MSEKSCATNRRVVVEPANILLSIDNSNPKLVMKTAKEQADEIISQARMQADAIINQAHQEANRFHEQGYNDGFSAGEMQACQDWQDRLEALDMERTAFLNRVEKMNSELEQDVLKLAVQIAEKIIHHEIETTPETIRDILRASLRQLKERAGVKIFVNKDDLEYVRSLRDDIGSWAESLRDVEIGEDRRVERGGVLIESPDGSLDARPSSQLKEIERKMMEEHNR